MPVCSPEDVIVRNVRGEIGGTDITGYPHGGRTIGISWILHGAFWRPANSAPTSCEAR
jgi:hypothetical protein